MTLIPELPGISCLQSLLEVQQGLTDYGGVSGCLLGKVATVAVSTNTRVMELDEKTRHTVLSLAKACQQL